MPNITGRKLSEHEQQAQEALRVSSEILRQLPDAITIMDASGKILRWMGASEQILGYSAAEVVGQSVGILYSTEGNEELFATIHEAVVQDGFYSGEIPCVRKEGGIVPMDVTIKPVLKPSGQPMFLVAIGRDISRRKQFEDEIRMLNADLERRVEERTADLRQSNEDLKQFAYVASHDLQEPLRTITSYTQLLENRYKEHLDGNAREFMTYIVEAAQRMSNLINDLLRYSRVANSDGLPPQRVSLVGIIEGVKLNLMKMIHETEAEVTYGDVPDVGGDETQLIQLFQNLVVNAIKYRRPQEAPRVHISAIDEGDCLHFLIHDNGIGIDPIYHERIFGLFKRLHGREIAGTGLGLAICRKIVEKHRGKLWVESSVGVGSTFHFTLPV